MTKQKGQVIVMLLLLMLVALSVGLAVTQKSVTDITTSTQTEQSSRAFSAAEGGIEKALGGTVISGSPIQFNNDSTATVATSPLLPTANKGIEYPPIGREITAQFWFTNPADGSYPYSDPSGGAQVDVYFGDDKISPTDKPAIEVKIVMRSGNQFFSRNYYYDSDGARTPNNHFTQVTGCGSSSNVLATGILGDGHLFYCKQTVPSAGVNIADPLSPGRNCIPAYNCQLILARIRFLYANQNHKLALAPVGTGVRFPPQVQVVNSRGLAGQSEKLIQAFRVIDVVPPWLDFAIFSVNEIKK